MDFLKKIWPTAFGVKAKDVASLIIQLLIFVLVIVAGGLLIWLLAHIPVVNIFTGILGTLLDIYGIVGIVLCILKFLDVLK